MNRLTFTLFAIVMLHFGIFVAFTARYIIAWWTLFTVVRQRRCEVGVYMSLYKDRRARWKDWVRSWQHKLQKEKG